MKKIKTVKTEVFEPDNYVIQEFFKEDIPEFKQEPPKHMLKE